MKRIAAYFAPLTFLLLLLAGCQKEESFPVEPAITFKDFKTLGHDSAQLTVTFTDGDGDIGLGQGDTFPPHKPGTHFYYNLFMRYYYKDTLGNYKPYLTYLNADTILDTLEFNYRVPYLTQNGQKESLTGDIVVTLQPFLLYHIPGHHTIRYETYIVDRELHVSNKVMSDDILIP